VEVLRDLRLGTRCVERAEKRGRPESTTRALRRHVAKLGNPAAIRTADGTLWLFYVTASVGGWGGSTVCWDPVHRRRPSGS